MMLKFGYYFTESSERNAEHSRRLYRADEQMGEDQGGIFENDNHTHERVKKLRINN